MTALDTATSLVTDLADAAADAAGAVADTAIDAVDAAADLVADSPSWVRRPFVALWRRPWLAVPVVAFAAWKIYRRRSGAEGAESDARTPAPLDAVA